MTVNNPLRGKAALVTGASSGIGRATADALAHSGSAVAIAARRKERLRELQATIEAEHDADVLVLQTDVTDETEVDRMVETTVEEFGGLDIVVNNAGVVRESPLESMSTEKYRTVMGVNADGAFFTTRAVVPHLRESSGNLVFVGSFSGQYPRPSSPIYAASKWWLRGFAFSLAGSLGPDDIAVTVVNPTGVRTEIGSEDRPVSNRERFDSGEAAEPEDVAEAIVFAAQQESPNTVNELDFYVRDAFSQF